MAGLLGSEERRGLSADALHFGDAGPGGQLVPRFRKHHQNLAANETGAAAVGRSPKEDAGRRSRTEELLLLFFFLEKFTAYLRPYGEVL